jgi:small-conductance mechanosensitive channel
VIGYAVCLYLARLIGRLAVTRLGMAPEVANLIRQWSRAFLVTILIVVSFMWVKIPPTIFAFFGGAFAIGVGFGAQTRIFTLNYWLEIRPDVDPGEVASELRFAIEQKFAEAGLKVLPAA